MPHPAEALKQPSGQHRHSLVDQVDADAADPVDPGRHVGDRQEVHRAVLEPGLVVEHPVPAALRAGREDRAAGEPRTAQPGERVPPRQQAAHSGREPEHLVPAHGHELGPHRGQVQPVRAQESRRVEQHVVPVVLGLPHPAQRVLHAAEVGLRRVGEQPGPGAVTLVERGGHVRGADPQLGPAQPGIRDVGAARLRVLPDPVDRVVVVGRQHEPGPPPPRVRLGDQAAGAGRVGREDDGVFRRRGVEEAQHRFPRLLYQARGRARRGIVRVRVAVAAGLQPRGVREQLRLRGKPGTRVVEVNVAALVQVGVLRRPQLVQPGRRGVLRIRSVKVAHDDPPRSRPVLQDRTRQRLIVTSALINARSA